MLLSYHTVEAHKGLAGEGDRLSAARREAEAGLAREARGVVFFTGQDMERTARVFPELGGKSFVIPPGIEGRFRVPVPREVARSILGLPASGEIFLYAARKDPGKNLSEALSAIRLVASRRGGRVSLVVAGQGTGPEPSAGPGEENVIYLGSVPHDSMALLYSAADASICPSRYESFGLVPLESLSAAVPAIAPEGTFWAEKFRSEGGGLCYSPDDPEGLANAMLSLLENPSLRARLSFEGPRVAGSFTWEKCIGSWAGLLSSVSTSCSP
jgi:glycosyltransferase involved in cell wall biosynthesis